MSIDRLTEMFKIKIRARSGPPLKIQYLILDMKWAYNLKDSHHIYSFEQIKHPDSGQLVDCGHTNIRNLRQVSEEWV